MNDIQVVIDEFLLDCFVIALNNADDLWTPGIDKQMGDICFSQSRKNPRVSEPLSDCQSLIRRGYRARKRS